MKTIRIIIGISCVLTALTAVGRLVLGYTDDVFATANLVLWTMIAWLFISERIDGDEIIKDQQDIIKAQDGIMREQQDLLLFQQESLHTYEALLDDKQKLIERYEALLAKVKAFLTEPQEEDKDANK